MEIKPVAGPKRRRRQLRNPNPAVPARITQAAAELLRGETFARLRVEEVATRAGVSVGTFYLYFDGKDDLFVQLVVSFTGRLRERLTAAYRRPGSHTERMQAALEAYLDFVEENEAGFLHFRDSGGIETTVGRLSTWAFDQHVEDLRPVIERAMDDGELRRADPVLVAQATLGLVQHLAGFWLENRRSHQREELHDFVGRLLMFGLSARPAPGT